MTLLMLSSEVEAYKLIMKQVVHWMQIWWLDLQHLLFTCARARHSNPNYSRWFHFCECEWEANCQVLYINGFCLPFTVEKAVPVSGSAQSQPDSGTLISMKVLLLPIDVCKTIWQAYFTGELFVMWCTACLLISPSLLQCWLILQSRKHSPHSTDRVVHRSSHFSSQSLFLFIWDSRGMESIMVYTGSQALLRVLQNRSQVRFKSIVKLWKW